MLKLLLWLNQNNRAHRLFFGTVVYSMVMVISIAVLSLVWETVIWQSALVSLSCCALTCLVNRVGKWCEVGEFLLIPSVLTVLILICNLIF